MHQDPQNNEEIIQLQIIEKELSTDQQLQQLCKQIGQQNQNPRLLLFLQELFKALINSYIHKDLLQKTIKILNNILNKSKFKNRPIQNSDLSHYINQKYNEVLTHFYEKAFLKGPDDAFKHMNFVYYKKIARDYLQSSNCLNPAMSKNILTKIDQSYQSFTGNTPQEFEMVVFDSLNQQEQELFTQIVSEDQSKAPKQTNSLQEKFLSNLPPDLQDKFKSSNFTDIQAFKDHLIQEKQYKGIEKILGYIFVDKLNFYLNSYYFVNSAKKIQENKPDLQKLLQELEKDIIDSQKDYFSFIDIPSVKYFYKSLKSKRVRSLKGQFFSFKKKLIEFIKSEINSFEVPKKFNITQFEKWNEIYFSLYSELQRATTIEESNLAFKIIQNVQQLILSFLKFRWNYLYLFCALIVEARLQQEELDQILDIAYDMMQNTNKANLNKPFDQILAQLNEKANTQIVSDYFDRNGHISGYTSLQMIESLLPYINNKLIKVMLQINLQHTQKIRLINELKTYEFQLIHDCSQNLRNYSKIFEKLYDSILEGEKEEKDQKASFLKAYPISYQQKLKLIVFERQNKQIHQQFYKQYQLNISKLKSDYQKRNLGPYQEIFSREEKISQICEQFILKEAEKLNQQYQNDVYKDLYLIFIETFVKDNPFIFFLPALLKGLGFFKLQKQFFFEKIERVRFAAVAFKDKDQNEINKFIEYMTYQKDLFTFEQQFEIAKNIYNFYIALPQYGTDCKPITDPFPVFSQMKSITDYNSTTYNAICFFTTKFFNQDQKALIKGEDQLKNSDLMKKISNLMSDKIQFENTQQDNFTAQYQELKNYKTLLIKEVQQINDQNFQNKCIEVFQKQASRQFIMNEIIEFKKQYKIPQNEIELYFTAKSYWIQVVNMDLRQTNDIAIKKRLEEYFKQVLSPQPFQQINDKLQKDMNTFQDPYIKDLLKKHYPKFKEDFDKNPNKSVLQTTQIKQSILQMQVIQKKLSLIRSDSKYRDFIIEDQQVLTFINEQFSLYMKQLLGKVFQVALAQKPGYELKVFQNKVISQNDTQMIKYRQNLELQGRFGPQKNSYLDISLLTSNENKNQLYYELCDYTPTQRQIEFRNFLIEIEPLQEDKLKNKIRKNKWKEEHPELEEILKKRIKRGAELWNQVQDFLCKRESNENMMDSDEESDKYKGQQQQIVDFVEDDQLDQKIQEVQRSFERQLLTGKNYIKTRLNNMDNDNPLLTLKEITVKTVQFVLEQHPYFKKSKILYKSYIL
ncbi:unnamed protein product [Paramecium pentaurelia]|uniref:Uncharacterized protein n=1 Tax=Paramecium pentaurelia TaxID=43138 RepID=A0A8S1THJ5_9CILI|nr:unnamed protein product [Paramecium pentaurelia]